MLNEFLVQMDGVGKDQTGVLVLGATNVVCDFGWVNYYSHGNWMPLFVDVSRSVFTFLFPIMKLVV